jgi:hypothetical protein
MMVSGACAPAGAAARTAATKHVCAVANGLIACSFDGIGSPEGLH